MNYRNTVAIIAALGFLTACGGGGASLSDRGGDIGGGGELSSQIVDKASALCVVNSDRRLVGEGLDAPGRLLDDSPPVGASPDACASNTEYQVGTGLHDITGQIADTLGPGWVNPQQVFSALHSRVYARAFAMESACNNRRIMFVSLDTGLMSKSIRDGVLAEISADEQLKDLYDARNVMLSVTHTHSDPGTGLTGANNGAAVLIGGTIEAIRKAHANLLANPSSDSMLLSSGELLNTTINRSLPAFVMNAEDERREFLNTRGEEIEVNKRMVQLELSRADGSAAGLINWFGIHPTVIGPAQIYVSGDVKGHASLGLEKLMGTDYNADPAKGTFVGAFAQADEGDVSPNIFINERPYPDPTRGGGVDELDSNAISGTKQLAKSLELYGTGDKVVGPIDYRFMEIPITDITVDDPVVLSSLRHPQELDEATKKTCDGVLGVSFGAGAEDGPGPTVEGVKCSDSPDVINAAIADLTILSESRLEGFPGGWPDDAIPPHLFSAALACNLDEFPFAGDFSCQNEKPILLPRGGSALPIQLFRVGQFALLGLPWEVTTISARRIRKLLLEELAPVGVETIVVAGLVNDYVHYLTTREEYSSQQYEGASTLYGPWTHAAVSQESLKLARAMRADEALGDAPAVGGRPNLAFNAGPREFPHPSGAPGTVVEQPAAESDAGSTISFEVVAGHPGNDLRLQQSYATVERMVDGGWETVAEDRDTNLRYIWNPLVKAPVPTEQPPISSGGTAQVLWDVPRNIASGTYRIRVAGKSLGFTSMDAVPYEATSNEFSLRGELAECP